MYNDNWSEKFLKEKLQDFDSAKEIISVKQNLLKIKRKKGIEFSAFTMSLLEIDFETIKEICEAHPELDFIVNIKKQYNLCGKALIYLSNKNISFGGLGDFMRFCNQEDNQKIEDKDFSFVARALRQHLKVDHIQRIDNRRINITRLGLSDVIAIMINDYDITTESVRAAKDLFKVFRVVIKTNPNGKITEEALEVGRSLNIDVCNFGDFLGKLNSQWI